MENARSRYKYSRASSNTYRGIVGYVRIKLSYGSISSAIEKEPDKCDRLSLTPDLL